MANGKPIIPSPYPIIPSPLQVRGIPNLSQVGTAQLPPTYLSTRAGIPSYTQLPQRVGESVMPSAVLTPQQRAARATANLAKLTQSRGGGSDVMPVTQQRQRGFFDSLPSPMSPAGQALGAFGSTALQLSGYQDRPITLGAGLGAAMQAAQEAYTAAEQKQYERDKELAPQFKTVGDTLYRVQNGQITGIVRPPKSAIGEIKAEGAQVRLKDGRIVDTVYDKFNNLYPVGVPMTEENRLTSDDYSTVNKYTAMDVNDRVAFRKSLKELEKPIKLIDSLASSVSKLDQGGLARIKRSLMGSLKNSAPELFRNMSDEELESYIITGKLTSLVGQSRLALFGPGVLTAPEAEMARQVFIGAGNVRNMNPKVALELLSSIRSDMSDSLVDEIEYFNSFEGNQYRSTILERPTFDWDAWSQGSVAEPSKSQSKATTTAGGNTFVIN